MKILLISSGNIPFEEQISSGTFLPRIFSTQLRLGTEGQRDLLLQRQCCVRNPSSVICGDLFLKIFSPVLFGVVFYGVIFKILAA